MGINRLAVVKSNNSKIVLSKIVISDNGPKERAQREPNVIAIPMHSIDAFSRVILSYKKKKAIEISAIEMVEVIDAKNNRKKNDAAQMFPPVV